MPEVRKQNLTISLSPHLIHQAKILAAKRSTSISGLLAEQVEVLVKEDDRYEMAAMSAIARMERGVHMGGGKLASREELHDR